MGSIYMIGYIIIIAIIIFFYSQDSKYILGSNENKGSHTLGPYIQKNVLSRTKGQQQIDVANLISIHNELLVYHGIGSGKSCTLISSGSKIKGKILILVPASVIPNFKNEFKVCCDYFDEKTFECDGSRFLILSYNKFYSMSIKPKCDALMIDEFQNINNPNGQYFKSILKYIEDNPNMKVVLASATPIFDNIKEIIGILKLLRRNFDETLCQICGAHICEHKLKYIDVSNLVHYYPGHDKSKYASSNIYYEICKMSPFQSKRYIENVIRESGEILEVHDGFMIQSRQKSNSVMISKFTKKNLKDKLYKYSCKFHRLAKYLKPKFSHTFIYSSFTNRSGVGGVSELLDSLGYLDFKKYGPGIKRYVIWDGKVSDKYRIKIRDVFNSEDNDDCSQIQIMVGSPAIKEGVSLLRVRMVHILETYWNHSRIDQIIGRAIRYLGHERLPESERNVDVHIYIAVVHDSGVTTKNFTTYRNDPNNFSFKNSIDLYMLRQSDKKLKLTKKVLDMFKTSF
jgi:hypothetical protein